jgi:hypothetical protein
MQGSQQEVTMQTRPWTVSEMIAQLDQQHNYVNDQIGNLWLKIDAYPVLLIFVPNCVPRLSFPAELQVMDGGNAVLQFRCSVPGHWLQLLALQPHKPKWVSVSKHIVQKQHIVWHGTISYPRVEVWIECQPRNEHCWSCNNWWQEPDTAALQQARQLPMNSNDRLGYCSKHETTWDETTVYTTIKQLRCSRTEMYMWELWIIITTFLSSWPDPMNNLRKVLAVGLPISNLRIFSCRASSSSFLCRAAWRRTVAQRRRGEGAGSQARGAGGG